VPLKLINSKNESLVSMQLQLSIGIQKVGVVTVIKLTVLLCTNYNFWNTVLSTVILWKKVVRYQAKSCIVE